MRSHGCNNGSRAALQEWGVLGLRLHSSMHVQGNLWPVVTFQSGIPHKLVTRIERVGATCHPEGVFLRKGGSFYKM